MRSWIRGALIPITMAMSLGSGAALAESNACKADLNGDGVVNFADLAIMKSVFFQPCTTPAPPAPLLATGQTTCWDSNGHVIPCPSTIRQCQLGPCPFPGRGQDGDLQKGAPLTYVDNGDGTITDANTGLMWEKLSFDGSIHDVNNLYTWDDAFGVKIAALNAGGGFAGHTDWRVPNYKELVSILDLQNLGPAVSPAFNTGCVASCTVTTCSCTRSYFYWSSSSYAFGPQSAWDVQFGDGSASANFKTFNFYVRAVRGGP